MVVLKYAPVLGADELLFLQLLNKNELFNARFLHAEMRSFEPHEKMNAQKFFYLTDKLVKKKLITKAKTGNKTVGFEITKLGLSERNKAIGFYQNAV